MLVIYTFQFITIAIKQRNYVQTVIYFNISPLLFAGWAVLSAHWLQSEISSPIMELSSVAHQWDDGAGGDMAWRGILMLQLSGGFSESVMR